MVGTLPLSVTTTTWHACPHGFTDEEDVIVIVIGADVTTGAVQIVACPLRVEVTTFDLTRMKYVRCTPRLSVITGVGAVSGLPPSEAYRMTNKEFAGGVNDAVVNACVVAPEGLVATAGVEASMARTTGCLLVEGLEHQLVNLDGVRRVGS
jgi:uncharacterized protein YqfA (UPF0365 family)